MLPAVANKLRVHVVSETAYMVQGQGVHTAFVDCVDLLRAKDDVEVVINNEGRGDVMHAHTYGPYYFWKGLRYRGRRVFTVHVIPDSIVGSLPASRLLMPFVRWYLRRAYAFASVCIAISPTVEDAIRAVGARTAVRRIPNPINVERFAPSEELRMAFRKRLGIPEEAFVVLGVGQLEGRKGVEDFLAVAEALPKLRFLWAGGRPFGMMTEGVGRLNRRIARAGPHVTFLGMLSLEDMPAVYNAADVLLFPSYQENCPLAPLEAAATGLPVVFRDLPEYRRLYTHPYLAAEDVPGFAALLERLSGDPSFRAEAQAISRELITQFDRWTVREQLVALYRELLSPHAEGSEL